MNLEDIDKPVKQELSSSVEQIPQIFRGGEGVRNKTSDDALAYLKEVRETFQAQEDKYQTFLDVMTDFKAYRINLTGVVKRVQDLFKRHIHLLVGFNIFLPEGFKITIVERSDDFEEAVHFVNKIKKRFQNDDQNFRSFLDIINMHKNKRKVTKEVFHEVATLFASHADLYDEFASFLPHSSSTTSKRKRTRGRTQSKRWETLKMYLAFKDNYGRG